ncbi:MAG: hypothetical protein JW915_13895 [Chitinispirillaceae bacterium]|nr:hypothetical protein [Chitinispirillaceae bacterium]
MIKSAYYTINILILFVTIHAAEISKYDRSVSVKLYENDIVRKECVNSNGVNFCTIYVKGMGMYGQPGFPELPCITKNFSGTEPDFHFEIRDSFVINGIQIPPQASPDIIGNEDISQLVSQDNTIASFSGAYPASPVMKEKLYVQRGVSQWAVHIVPFRYDQNRNTLTVYSDISVNFTTGLLKKQSISPSFSENPIGKKSLIVTVDSFKLAADTLKLWHLMQGFEAEVITAPSWSRETIASQISRQYAQDDTVLAFVTLLGDLNHLPSKMGIEAGDTFYTDIYYYCMDGDSDYIPDIAAGRIPAETRQQALGIVSKIKQFGSNPPGDPAFYKTFLACSYFQDKSPEDGYADRSFAQTANNVAVHLDSMEYTSNRIFYTDQNVTPLYWNKDNYEWGSPLPAYLKTPDFVWNGSQDEIIKGINTGTFFTLHYDHGFFDGWEHPAFYKSQFSRLTNDGLLPLVLSVNCYTGEFHTESFAKQLLRMQNGGALGVIAASGVSYSGYNDGLIAGIIDAIWPRFKLNTPKVPDPDIPSHTPYYRLGNILQYAYTCIAKNWSTYYARYGCEVFHLFGDPVTQLFIQQPGEITADIPDTLLVKDSIISFLSVNNDSVTITVLSPGGLCVLGKVFKTGENQTVKIDTFPAGTCPVIIAITGRNIRPLIKSAILVNTTANKLPSVDISCSGSVFPEGEDISFNADASDSDGIVVSVRCFVDSQLLTIDKQPPYLWSLQSNELLRNLVPGSYNVWCIAEDEKGGTATDSVTVTIYQKDSLYLSLENSLQDSFGNYDAVAYGDPEYVTGFKGTSVFFDGIRDHFSVPFISKNDFSCMFWIKCDTAASKDDELIIDGTTGLHQGLNVLLHDKKNVVSIGDTNNTVNSVVAIADGFWHHCAFVRNGNNGLISIVVDGVLQDSAYAVKGTLTAPDSLCFGGKEDSLKFTGFIDEVNIFNWAVSLSDIKKRIPSTFIVRTHDKVDPRLSFFYKSGKLVIANTYPADIKTIIFDVNGRLVQTTSVSPGRSVLNCYSFARGVYFLSYRLGKSRTVFSFFKF